MDIGNRAAEYGSKIIDDTAPHNFESGSLPIALEVLADNTTISAISSNIENDSALTGITFNKGDQILGNINAITLSAGIVQAIYGHQR